MGTSESAEQTHSGRRTSPAVSEGNERKGSKKKRRIQTRSNQPEDMNSLQPRKVARAPFLLETRAGGSGIPLGKPHDPSRHSGRKHCDRCPRPARSPDASLTPSSRTHGGESTSAFLRVPRARSFVTCSSSNPHVVPSRPRFHGCSTSLHITRLRPGPCPQLAYRRSLPPPFSVDPQ